MKTIYLFCQISLEHCQLSECVWSDWSHKENSCGTRNCTRTKINADLPKFGGKSCKEVAGCDGIDCQDRQGTLVQIEKEPCGMYESTSPLALLCTRLKNTTFSQLSLLNSIISLLTPTFRLLCHTLSFVYN